MAGPNFLERFRPLGTPGAAESAGGPPAGDLGSATELAPVVAALAPTVEECRTLVEEATRTAERDLVAARERASALVAQARLDVGREQAAAAGRVLAAAARDDSGVLDAAARAAAEVRLAGSPLIDDAVTRVLDRLVTDVLAPR